MSHAVPLSPLSTSLLAQLDAENDAAGRAAIDALANLLRARQGWMGRKKLLLDHIAGLEVMVKGAWLQAAREGQTHPADSANFASAEEQFAYSAPVVVGAALEALAEPAITSVEQAACYIVSSHSEHHAAAFAYLQGDPGRVKAWRKLLRNDRQLRGWMKEITRIGDALDEAEATGASA